QPHIAAIEAGRRRPSAHTLACLLRAADYRPSLPLARYAEEIRRRAATHGIDNVRVFGSAARGGDTHDSDIDLLIDIEPGRSYLDVAAFINEVEDLTGFTVDILLDRLEAPGAAVDEAAMDEAVPL